MSKHQQNTILKGQKLQGPCPKEKKKKSTQILSQFSTENYELCKETEKCCPVTEREEKKKTLTKAIPEKADTGLTR